MPRTKKKSVETIARERRAKKQRENSEERNRRLENHRNYQRMRYNKKKMQQIKWLENAWKGAETLYSNSSVYLNGNLFNKNNNKGNHINRSQTRVRIKPECIPTLLPLTTNFKYKLNRKEPVCMNTKTLNIEKQVKQEWEIHLESPAEIQNNKLDDTATGNSDFSESTDFVPATSDNLPKVNMFAIVELFAMKSSYRSLDYAPQGTGDNTGDDCISCVEVRKQDTKYTIQGTVAFNTTESNTCVVKYEERDKIIEHTSCDCQNSACEHVIAFVMWLHRRTEERIHTQKNTTKLMEISLTQKDNQPKCKWFRTCYDQ